MQQITVGSDTCQKNDHHGHPVCHVCHDHNDHHGHLVCHDHHDDKDHLTIQGRKLFLQKLTVGSDTRVQKLLLIMVILVVMFVMIIMIIRILRRKLFVQQLTVGSDTRVQKLLLRTDSPLGGDWKGQSNQDMRRGDSQIGTFN